MENERNAIKVICCLELPYQNLEVVVHLSALDRFDGEVLGDLGTRD